MNIKNAIIIISTITCAAPTSTRCMMNGVKNVIDKLGTAIGLSPAVTVPTKHLYAAYKIYTNPIEDMEKGRKMKTREPFASEEAFLRLYVEKDIMIRIIDKGADGQFGMTNCTNLIAIQEVIPEISIPVSKIAECEKNDKIATFIRNDGKVITSLADVYIGVIQHEIGHFKNKDLYRTSVMATAIAIATTLASAKTFQKVFPKNSNASLSQIILRSMAKLGGAYIIHCTTEKLKNTYNKQCEYRADLYIDESRRASFCEYMDYRSLIETSISQKLTFKQSFNAWLRDTHPTLQQRQHRLMKSQKK